MIAKRENLISQLRQISHEELLKKRKRNLIVSKLFHVTTLLFIIGALVSLILGQGGPTGIFMGSAAMQTVGVLETKTKVWFIDLVLAEGEQPD